jgi:gamma-glutamylcyclotransferase (GGCT)/AIG2-like uncharacterized protein YtfP
MPLHFAYGSNMDPAGMARRCPGAKALGPARLEGHRFIIARAGYASVQRKSGAVVHGVLWRVADSDVAALDAYEDVAGGLYRRMFLPVRLGNDTMRALVYLARDQRPGRPLPRYQEELVLPPARAWGFPTQYLEELARAGRG